MPEYLKALVVIVAIGSMSFYVFKPVFVGFGVPVAIFNDWRKYWFGITLALFLSTSYWIFVAFFICILIYAKKKSLNWIAIYFFLILSLPLLRVDIPGFGAVRFLVEIDFIRVATIILLLPICLKQWRQKNVEINQLRIYDALIGAYLILTIVLRFRVDDFIGIIRYVFYCVVDVAIPYYAISRAVNKIDDFKQIMAGFAMSGLVVAVLAVFEFFKRWLLYTSVNEALSLDLSTSYLDRGDFLRAMVTSGQPIVLGYDLIAVMGAILFMSISAVTRWRYYLAVVVVIFGSIASLSKGPWVGLALMVAILIMTDNQSAKKLVYAILTLIVGFVFLMNTDFGTKAIEYLPFVGTLDEGSMTYRQLLFDKSIEAIGNNIWFGSDDYLYGMEELRQGQGIIDLVNTYLIVALDSGLVGLALFGGYFLFVVQGVYVAAKAYKKGSVNNYLGRLLLAIIVGLLFVLAACSPISHIPTIYIGFSALALSYCRIAEKLSV